MLKRWNKLYLVMGVIFLSFSTYLVSTSFFFKKSINNINYAAIIETTRTSQDTEQIRTFLIENLEYQQDLEQHRINMYLYTGLLLLISSLLVLGASHKKPDKSSD